MTEADLRHQALKAQPAFDTGARAAKIIIDHYNHLPRPAEMEGAIDQSVLQPRRFLVAFNLLDGCLADVDDCQAFTMPAKDLLGQAATRLRRAIPVCHHRMSPRWSAGRCSRRCGSGASPSGRAPAPGRADVRSAASPKLDGAKLRSSRNPR